MTDSKPSRVVLVSVVIAITGPLALGMWRWVVPGLKREDTHERFARLSACMLPALARADALPVKPTAAEESLEWDRLRKELKTLGQECRDLAPIAREAESQINRGLELASKAPAPSGLVLAGLETAVGYSLRSSEMMESGSKGLLTLAADYTQLYHDIKAVRVAIQAQQIALFEQAPRFSGAPAEGAAFAVHFTEEKPLLINRILDGDPHSMNGTQTLSFTNRSNRDLTTVLISVRLIEKDGDSFRHIYHVAAWKDGERLTIQYTPEFGFAETSKNVTRLQARIYSRELSSAPMELKRDGAAWPYTRD